jgi:septin family protein
VRRTLAALPTVERPGRLTREPPPAGFSLLTGVKPRPVDAKQSKREQRPVTISTGPSREELRLMKLEQARLKEAEERARKEEEKARKVREKREREIQKAEQALREAERRLAELKR